MSEIIDFLLKAKRSTYAGSGVEIKSPRPNSHDFQYEQGNLKYIDSYFGGSKFSGQEVLFESDNPFWSMNYYGMVLDGSFNGEFLKEALSYGSENMPYRGPAIYRNQGYEYLCTVEGDFSHFSGHEEIFKDGLRVYQCIFHGGDVE